MSALFDNLSEELFQIIKGSGKTVTLYDESGNKTYEPSAARQLFATPDNFMVSVQENGSDSQVQLFLSDSTDIRAMSRLINTLRHISTRYNVLFNVRKFGKELSPKDFAFRAVSESAMWGSTKTSYQKFNSAKLIVRHTIPVREGIIGSRGRNILSMFVETTNGERFRFPENHLSAGRAFANHIANGGQPHDEVSLQIVEMAKESLSLSSVNRFIYYGRKTLDESALDLRSGIRSRIVEIRKAFVSMTRPRGYSSIIENGLPIQNTKLTEDSEFGQVLENLQTLLHIDSNHALAETLMPVALLIMGENMNINHEHDLAGSEVDESTYDPYSDNDGGLQAAIDDYIERFEPLEFLHEYYPEALDDTIDIADRHISKASVVKSIQHDMNLHLEAMDIMGANEAGFHNDAVNVFDEMVKPEIEQMGIPLAEDELNEFTSAEDKPSGPGFKIGDYVGSDIGSGQISELDGDIAVVDFLHGGSKKIHVDDLDPIGDLGSVQEELELAEWFDSFSPESVLGEGPNWANAIPPQTKPAPVDPDFDSEIRTGDRVTHKAYGTGTVKNMDDKFTKVEFDETHPRLPDHKTVSLHKATLTKAGAYRKPDIRKKTDEAMNTTPSFITYIDLPDADDVEVTVEYEIEDGTFATGLDVQPYHSYGDSIEIVSIVIKDTGAEIDFGQLDRKTQNRLINEAGEDAASQDNGPDPDAYRDDMHDRMMDSIDAGESLDEGLGGDLGINLIDEVEEDPDRDIYDMSNDELPGAYKNSWKSRGTMQALERMDKIKDEMGRRGMNLKNFVAGDEDPEAVSEAKQGNPHRNADDDACSHCGDADCHGECYEPEEVDEAFRSELTKLLKNARFRM